jgi:hypothetical protein
MERWAYDRWKTTPPAEPESVAFCANCEADLFDGGEYVHDLETGDWYCDTDCYFEKMRDNIVTEVIEAPKPPEREEY